ncbi:MAG: C1 family peptidase [Bacteroidales bacterium]|nr:C1 family peptidase [Bacteroidales bacterium]
MKKILTLALACVCISAAAQTPGSITNEMLAEISKGYEGSAYDKAVRNAINTTSITVLTANAENSAMIDTNFSDRVKTIGITDQKSSGRCWLFTGLNVLRAAAIDKWDLGNFQFSQNYNFFWDQLEKANLFLQAVIDTRELEFEDRQVDWLFSNPISDGGTFTGVANLVTKYGLVPASAMPESYVANNTSAMATHLKTLLRKWGLALRETPQGVSKRQLPQYLQDQKVRALKEVYHVLAICLGVPPTEFEWKGKTYTPLSFYQELLGYDLEGNYVMLMNDPVREYGKVYEIEYDRHTYDGQNWLYVNLPIERIKEMAIASIKANVAMYFSCDVAKFLNRTTGVADLNNFDYESLLGVDLSMDKRQRVMTHASGSSHAMTLIAVDLKEGVPQKWMVENSWGAASGYKGNIIMTDEWFNEYMFRLVVEKRFVPEDVLKMLEQEPIKLPSWDPMFLDE